MADLMFGVSGVRGIVNKTLTKTVAEKLGSAFAEFVKAGKPFPHLTTNELS